jgi:hypothetical protein
VPTADAEGTQGNDVRVLLGGLRTLPAVRYLEFEHHAVNRWARSDLQDTVRLLFIIINIINNSNNNRWARSDLQDTVRDRAGARSGITR